MSKKTGFTLIEVLIVVTIVSILTIIGIISVRKDVNKARDADRKQDLQRLSVAFEDYYNDHDCYPEMTILNNCGDAFDQYLSSIPCDPITTEPYIYETESQDLNCPQDFKILAKLTYEQDPIINSLNCSGPIQCGYEPGYNYGVTSTNVTVANPATNPAPSASPNPINHYYAWDETCGCTYRGTNPPPCTDYWINSCQEACSQFNQCPD